MDRVMEGQRDGGTVGRMDRVMEGQRDGGTEGRRDGRTDTAAYRDARTHLKIASR